MATAIALRKQDIAVDLVEIDPAWQVAGAGLSLGGATLRAFQALGILDDFLRHNFAGQGTQLCTPDGTLLAALPTPNLTGTDIPGNGAIMRPVQTRIMERATRGIGGVDIRLGCRAGRRGSLVLAEELARGPLEQALERFMERRWERCRMVVENSIRLDEIEKHAGDKEEHARIMRVSFAALSEPI